jgi:two-component system sensor histidine kinase CpxA
MMGPWTLTRKILCLSLLNLVLLVALVLLFMRSQFGLGEQTLLLGPAREHVLALGNSFALEYEATPPQARDELLARYARRFQAEVYLVTPRATAIAGPALHAPEQVISEMRKNLPPPHPAGDRPLPPPRKREAPPPPPRKQEDGPPPPRKREEGPPPPEEAPGPPPIRAAESVFLSVARDPTSYWVGVRVPIEAGQGRPNEPAVLLLHTASMFNSQLFFDWRLWAGVALSIVAVSVLCWVPFIQGLTRSIAQMDRATAQIAAGRFDVTLLARRGDELGHLAEQINHMSSRLQSFVKNQKRFLGDIAHELCAPIARIQFALGILEQKAEDAQRPHVAALHDEIQEMSALVNELLSFSKAGLHPDAAPVLPVDVSAVVQRAVARESFAEAQVELDVPAGLTAMAGEALLLRALSNVLRNAIRYAGKAGPITVSARREGPQVAITIADSGPGLPESELDAVFAPFYRPESARDRETGGVGLGLAIVQTCVEACRGTVTCRNRKPSGLEVKIRLTAW